MKFASAKGNKNGPHCFPGIRMIFKNYCDNIYEWSIFTDWKKHLHLVQLCVFTYVFVLVFLLTVTIILVCFVIITLGLAIFTPVEDWSIHSTQITNVTFHPIPHNICQHLTLNFFLFQLISFLLCNTALFWAFLLWYGRSFSVTLQASCLIYLCSSLYSILLAPCTAHRHESHLNTIRQVHHQSWCPVLIALELWIYIPYYKLDISKLWKLSMSKNELRIFHTNFLIMLSFPWQWRVPWFSPIPDT